MKKRLCSFLLTLCLLISALPTTALAYSGTSNSDVRQYYKYTPVASQTNLPSGGTYYQSNESFADGFKPDSQFGEGDIVASGTTDGEGKIEGKFIYSGPAVVYTIAAIKAENTKEYNIGDRLDNEDFTVIAYYSSLENAELPSPAALEPAEGEELDDARNAREERNEAKIQAFNTSMAALSEDPNWYVVTVSASACTMSSVTMPAPTAQVIDSETITASAVTITYGGIGTTIQLSEPQQYGLSSISTYGAVVFNGDVEVTSATSGAVVNIAITPFAGYEVVSATTGAGTIIGLTLQDGKWTGSFTMEATDTAVTVEYKKANYKVTVTEPDSQNGSLQILSGSAVLQGENLNSIPFGTELTVSASAVSGGEYILSNVRVENADGSEIIVNNKKFNMPAGNVTVSAIFVESTPDMQNLNELLTTPNMTLVDGTYYLTADLKLNGQTGYIGEINDTTYTGVKGNGLKIAEGAEVRIYLNGYTLTAIGLDATKGSDGLAGLNGSGDNDRPARSNNENHGAGGFAGILLPETSTLYFVGSGTVNAQGGNAGNGGNGGQGGKGTSDVHFPPPINSDDDSSGGGGGQGGGGGGGAGAGIGTNGSAGYTYDTDPNEPKKAGALIFCEDEDTEDSIITNVTGGSIGEPGRDGAVGSGSYSKKYMYYPGFFPLIFWDEASAGGGGGGGQGAAGGCGASYGSGGYGGQGGAFGTSGGSDHTSTKKENKMGSVGNAGAAGKNGAFGTAAASDNTSNVDYSAVTVKTTSTNFALKGITVESKFSDVYGLLTNGALDTDAITALLTDETSDDSIDVWAYYGNSETSFTSSAALNGNYDDDIKWKVWKLERINLKDGGSIETYTTAVAYTSAASITTGAICDVNLATITVTYAAVNHNTEPSESNISASDTVGIGRKQAVTKNMTTGAVVVEGGDAVKFNDGKEPLNIAKTVQVESQTVYNQGAAYIVKNYDHSDYKFNNSSDRNHTLGVLVNTNNKTYTVQYTPYNAYTSASAEKHYLDQNSVETNVAVSMNYTSLCAIAFHNAGLYEITETWTRHDDRFVGTDTHNMEYQTTYFVVIQQADLEIVNAIDTVSGNTTVQDHIFDRVVVGRNAEQILGQYTFASNQATSTQQTYCYNESWEGANAQNQSANSTTPHITNIAWEFNVKRTYTQDDNPDGNRNMNNYLDQNDGTKLSIFNENNVDPKTIGNTSIDGTTLKADQNTFYSGSNGELHYDGTGVTVLRDNEHLTVQARYEKDQKITANNAGSDNAKTAWKASGQELDENVATTATITSVFAEDVAFGAKFSNEDYGFRVNYNDCVSGEIASGKHITSIPSEIAVTKTTNDEVTQKATTITGTALFNKLVDNKQYKGDYYVVSVKDANGKLVKAWEYNDKDDNTPIASNVPSGSEYELDSGNVWDAFNVGTYTVTVEYVGLYYQNATGDNGRKADWSGTESFNWVTGSKSFKLQIEKRNVAYKQLNDLYKVYDSTNLLVKDTLSNGDVTKAEAYIIDLSTNCSSQNQFAKGLSNNVDGNSAAGTNNDDALYNFLKPVNKDSDTTLKLELAGVYDGVDANSALSDSSIKARFVTTTNKDEDNYNLIKVNNQTLSGTIFTAQMHVSHMMVPAVIVYNTTPMRDVLDLHAKAYMPAGRTMSYATSGNNAGYLAAPATFSLQELVSKDDATGRTSVYPGNDSTKYDYDAEFELILDSKSSGLIYNRDNHSYTIKEDGFKINSNTGAVEYAAKNTIEGSSVDLLPRIKFNLKDFNNYIVVKQTENAAQYPTETHGQCSEGAIKNGPRKESYFPVGSGVDHNENVATGNTLTHTLRYTIVGNGDTFNLILPINQLNKREAALSVFDNKAGEATIAVGEEQYKYVTVYENGDSADFTFTLPQDSYLKDVMIVAIPANEQGKTPTMDSSLMPKLASIDTNKLVGQFSNNANGKISDEYDSQKCGLSLELLNVNGVALGDAATYFGGNVAANMGYTAYKLADPNEQIGGSTYTFRLITGESGMGTQYNIVVIPKLEKFGFLLGDHATTNKYITNLSVEKKTTSATNNTLISGRDDSVYINYQALWDTTEKNTAHGIATMTYGAVTKTFDLSAANKGFNSFEIATDSLGDFFNPEKLVPGTQVDVTLKVWRNGVVSGEQTGNDTDVYDTVSFKWTVSDADYFALFGDDVVTFYDGNSRIGYGIIGSSATTMDFTAVKFVATSGTTTAAKNMKTYTKANYTVNGWFTNSALTAAVTYTGEQEKLVDISSNKVFYLKSTYNGGGGGAGGGGGGGAPATPTPEKEEPKPCLRDNTCVYAKYIDANTKAWYHDGVHFCVEKGYMNGVSLNEFAPDSPLSRGMIVTMLWRMEGSPVVNYEMSFEDVASGRWYTEAIRWAQYTGVVKGYDGSLSFGPNDNITREQVATILNRYASYNGIDVSTQANLAQYTDAYLISSWALDSIKWANAVGIINGRTEDTIVPTGESSRAEAACMVQRFCEKVLEAE